MHQQQHRGLHAKAMQLDKRDTSGYSDNVKQFIHVATHNTNSQSIKLNVPEDYTEDDTTVDADSVTATAVSVVYVTMSATFSGSIAGYVTATADAASSTDSSVASVTSSDVEATAASAATSQSTPYTAAVVSAISSSSSSSTVTYTPMVGTPIATTRTTSSTSAATALSDSTTNDSASVSQTSSGMNGAAKAGLAIGLLAGIALALGLFFFCWKRAKKDTHEGANEKSTYNEKRGSFFGGSAAKRASADSDKSFGTLHHTATAPRLSLRPVTQFLPTFGAEKRKSGNMLGGAPQMSEKSGENPFNDVSEKQANPFDESDARSIHSTSSGKQSLESYASSGVAAGAQDAQRTPSNVHRVQLDFKPSMDDELELKSGQLVRMLHEYDDGWALCVRMDRSQQGVAPRTCLSKTPVKPRGPPPAGRTSPQGQMRGPPSQGGPMTPANQSQPGVARKPVPGQAL